ncbi:MAG TPA: NUDIX domain-containing protein [Cellvibrionaceae bacterium]|nr:NUDIX domain-containing protein [Cellvibrionaceae bacterium]
MNKACPIILRDRHGITEILGFSHPLAGKQLVKGTIENGETLEQACARELIEESGIAATPSKFLGEWNSGYEGQIWGFYLMRIAEKLPDHWEFSTSDDGGHIFSFFWHRLDEIPDPQWHPLFAGAINFVKKAITDFPDEVVTFPLAQGAPLD